MSPQKPVEYEGMVPRAVARRRLRAISSEIDAITDRRLAAWGDLALHPSGRTVARIKVLSHRLTSLWAEAGELKALIRGTRRTTRESRASQPGSEA